MIAVFSLNMLLQTISYEVIHVSGEVYIGSDSIRVTENMIVTDIDKFIFTSFESRIILIGTDSKKYFRGGRKKTFSKYENSLISEIYDMFIPIIIPTWSKDGLATTERSADGSTYVYFDTLKLDFPEHEEIFYWKPSGAHSLKNEGTTFNIPSIDLSGKNSISLYTKNASTYKHLATIFIRKYDKKRVISDLKEIRIALEKIGIDENQVKLYQLGFLERAYGRVSISCLEKLLIRANE